MAPRRVVPGLDPVEDRRLRVLARLERAAAEQFLLERGGRAKIVPISKAKKGDIIVMDWGGGKPGTPKFTGDHTMIVTGHGKDGNPLLAGHSTNRFDLPLFGKPGSKSEQGIEGKEGKHPTFICLQVLR